MSWKDELWKYGQIAINTGQELKFKPRKRESFVEWRISLEKIVSNGKEEIAEED